MLPILSYPCVMGICNCTPDSFYDGGSYNTSLKALHHIESMIEQGAAIIDIGAYSSRPGALDISVDEEFARLAPVLREVRRQFPHIPISIDTFRGEIVRRVFLEFGAVWVNDISGGMLDNAMFTVCADYNLPYVCMHMQGTPQTMQQTTTYTNMLHEIHVFFEKQLQAARTAGMTQLVIDPGFGFGKTVEQNYELLQNMHVFSDFSVPILVGVSRKSMIYKALKTNAEGALNGTTALHMVALQQGASILRVHDVREAVEVVTLFTKYMQR